MASESLVPLPGSHRSAPRGARLEGSIDDQKQIAVTVVMDRKNELPEHGFQEQQDRQDFNEQHGADPSDIALVERFAHNHGLTVIDSSTSKRRVILGGTIAAMHKAFDVQLHCYEIDNTSQTFRGRTGTLFVPQDLQDVVVAVLGLDDRPVAKPHFRVRKPGRTAHATQPSSFTPPQVAALYGFPSNLTGAGQTVAIIELGGGYSPSDLATYFQSLNLKAPNVTAVSVDGGTNSPGGSADGEVLLDIEVVGSIAPGANIAVYFAPNTDQGFIDAITDAVHDATRKPSIISVSWGGPEDSWTAQSQTAMNAALQDAAALGVTVTVAAGDNGSSDGETGALHVDFPASSPFVLACGGTTLTANGSTIANEVVWNETAANEGATGGGVSAVFALPTYQQSANVPLLPTNQFKGRGVPDVAGDADPTTGYQVLVDGQNQVVGGTSAVAPLWAALIALLNQQLGKKLGFINPTLYSLGESVFRDITSGNNDDSKLGFYSAVKGWDPCTGLGSPRAAALLSALSSTSSSSVAKSGN